MNSVNFTWELREFTKTNMRIKLNFSDPLSVSPNLRYDRLIIYIDQTMNMFNKVSRGRALSHTRYEAEMSKPI